MLNIAIQGVCGRMGQALVRLLNGRSNCRVSAGVDIRRCDGLPCPVVSDCTQLPADTGVLIDFSHPDATRNALQYCAKTALPCVVCTTGLNDGIKMEMQRAAQHTAVFYSANMSLGVNLLAQLACRAQALLPGFDIEIVEKHHHNKLDAPSGTALMLAEEINSQANGKYVFVYDRHDVRTPRGENEIGISAVRAGNIVGEHEVLFAGQNEVLTLSHEASSRDVFAAGAIAAALYLAQKKAGLYSMKELLEAL